jgi:hypothetical protein
VGQFWTPMVGQISKPIDTTFYEISTQWALYHSVELTAALSIKF